MVVFFAIVFSASAFSEDVIMWRDLFSNITPCAMNATLFIGGQGRNIEKIATVYLEFPDNNHMFQHSVFSEPLPISIISFSSRDLSVIHDFYTDKIMLLPQKLLPLNSFSQDGGDDSFFNSIVFTDKLMDVNFEGKNIELEVSSPELRISPGIYIQNVRGYIWVNGDNLKPRKMTVSGTVDIGNGEESPINMLIDFSYGKFIVSTSQWATIESSILSFQKKQKVSESAIRIVEKSTGKLPPRLPLPNK